MDVPPAQNLLQHLVGRRTLELIPDSRPDEKESAKHFGHWITPKKGGLVDVALPLAALSWHYCRRSASSFPHQGGQASTGSISSMTIPCRIKMESNI